MSEPLDVLAALADAVDQPLFALDTDFRYVYVNATQARLLGRPREAIVGRTPADIGLPEPLVEAIFARLRAAFDTDRSIEHVFTAPTPDGDRRFLVRIRAHDTPAGRRVFGAGSDITAVSEAETARRDAEERFQAFMRHLPVNAWMKDDAGRYVFVNEYVARDTGRPADEWVGKTATDFYPPEVVAESLADDRRMMDTGEVLRTQTEAATGPAGRTRTFATIKFPITDSAGRRFLGGVALDISYNKRLEDEKKDAARMLQAQKLESLGVLAGGIAHDFNNLLTAMLGFASLARLDAGEQNYSALPEYLESIETAAQRAADLCRQMLTYAGRGQMAVRPTPVNQLVEEMTQLLYTSVSKKAVLRTNLSADLPTVLCDPTQIRQVVMNLITNASDAIGDRSGVITLTTGLIDADEQYLTDISAEYLRPGRYVYLEVSDTGCGMPDDVKVRIFEPFFSTKFTGRGLGLSAVIGIVRGHGGAIKVYTQVGKGTTFKVLLPTADTAAPAEAEPSGVPAAFGRERAVLVVDDEEDVRVFARKVLTRAGFVVEVAADGRAGVNAYRRDPAAFALVLLDLTMPHMDGAAAFREMRQTRKDVKVILSSGYAAEDATAGFEGKGLAAFLRKPFRTQELLQAVYDAVGP